MKKIVKIFSVAAAIFIIGCGDGDKTKNEKSQATSDIKITNEMVKNYENGLNQAKKEILEQINKYDEIVKMNDFKCQKDKISIVCHSHNFDLMEKDKKIATIDDIEIKTNAIYTGDKTGEISLVDFYENVKTHDIIEEYNINGLKLEQIALNLSEEDKKILNDFLDGNINAGIKVSTKNSDVMDSVFDFTFKNTSKNSELSFKTNIKINPEILKVIDKLEIVTFDVNKQDIDIKNDNLYAIDDEFMAQKGISEKDFFENINLKNHNLKVVFPNIYEKIKESISQDIANIPNENVSNKLKDIFENIVNNKPHTLSLNVDYKNAPSIQVLNDLFMKMSKTGSSEDFDNFISIFDVKLNGVEINDILSQALALVIMFGIF